jgi:hypothetical protein
MVMFSRGVTPAPLQYHGLDLSVELFAVILISRMFNRRVFPVVLLDCTVQRQRKGP